MGIESWLRNICGFVAETVALRKRFAETSIFGETVAHRKRFAETPIFGTNFQNTIVKPSLSEAKGATSTTMRQNATKSDEKQHNR